jgi:hypothetical protein
MPTRFRGGQIPTKPAPPIFPTINTDSSFRVGLRVAFQISHSFLTLSRSLKTPTGAPIIRFISHSVSFALSLSLSQILCNDDFFCPPDYSNLVGVDYLFIWGRNAMRKAHDNRSAAINDYGPNKESVPK